MHLSDAPGLDAVTRRRHGGHLLVVQHGRVRDALCPRRGPVWCVRRPVALPGRQRPDLQLGERHEHGGAACDRRRGCLPGAKPGGRPRGGEGGAGRVSDPRTPRDGRDAAGHAQPAAVQWWWWWWCWCSCGRGIAMIRPSQGDQATCLLQPELQQQPQRHSGVRTGACVPRVAAPFTSWCLSCNQDAPWQQVTAAETVPALILHTLSVLVTACQFSWCSLCPTLMPGADSLSAQSPPSSLHSAFNLTPISDHSAAARTRIGLHFSWTGQACTLCTPRSSFKQTQEA